MNLAVKLYSNAPSNPLNIPGAWPYEVIELGESTTLPDNTYQLMTSQELVEYRSNHQAEYDAWYVPYVASLPVSTPQPAAVIVTSQPDPVPFAQPTYRTKRDALPNLVSCAKGETADIDFVLTSERYVSGGEIIVENAEIGDYIVASVQDPNGLIPAPYRSVVCENWPMVAEYISKCFMPISVPGTIQAGSISTYSIDTYPLNAKISQGLSLRISYHAVNSGLTRRVAVNYHLTKKM
jgi:hypothetical protein